MEELYRQKLYELYKSMALSEDLINILMKDKKLNN